MTNDILRAEAENLDQCLSRFKDAGVSIRRESNLLMTLELMLCNSKSVGQATADDIITQTQLRHLIRQLRDACVLIERRHDMITKSLTTVESLLKDSELRTRLDHILEERRTEHEREMHFSLR